MTRLFIAASVWLGVGLAAGVFYREFTKGYTLAPGQSDLLGLVHTHVLVLGFLALLVVLLLEKVFALSTRGLFGWFFWVYNAGLVVTTATMIWHGVLDVVGVPSTGAIAGIAGLGHIALSAGLVLLLVGVWRAIRADGVAAAAASTPESSAGR